MRPIATDAVAWSVCLSVGHICECFKDGRTVKQTDSHGYKGPCIKWKLRWDESIRSREG